MEAKKRIWGASILFLVLVVINIAANFIPFGDMPIYLNILIPQALIIVPVLVYAAVTRQNLFRLIRFRKVNLWSLLLVIPLVGLLEPVIICVNAFSMAFSTNVIAGTMEGITGMLPYVAGISLMALLPAVVEETTFRGVLLNSFHRDSNPWPAILFSALCFGCMHMNFNQIAYALILGIFMGILLEASGSILSTMLLHFLFNATSTSLMYLLPYITQWSNNVLENSGMSAQELEQVTSVSEAAAEYTSGQMLMLGGIMIVPALISLVLAVLLIYAIAYLNRRHLIIRGMVTKKTPEQKLARKADRVPVMNVFLGIGMGLCVAMAIFTEFVLKQ